MEPINLGGYQELRFYPSEFTGVAVMSVTNSETGETIYRTLLSEAKALWAAVALVEASGLLPTEASFNPPEDWKESLRDKNWDAYAAMRTLHSMGMYRNYLEMVKEQEDAHTQKIAKDAEALYNLDRSACDLIWPELTAKQKVRWINIATKAEELNKGE